MWLDWTAFLLLIILYVAFSGTWFTSPLQSLCSSRGRALLITALLAVPFVLANLSTFSHDIYRFLTDFGRLFLYLLTPALLTLYRPKDAPTLNFTDVVAILALWLPVEFGWLPKADAHTTSGVSFPIRQLTAVNLGFFLYLILRPLPQMGYNFRIRRSDLRIVLLSFSAFLIVGIPLGLASNFLALHIQPFDLPRWILIWVLGFFFTALPEEMLFRGIIQQQMETRFGNRNLALGIGAVIFGLAHINNATTGYPEPNWMYAIMATLAGLAYGYTWMKTGKITASALVHASANFVWATFLEA